MEEVICSFPLDRLAVGDMQPPPRSLGEEVICNIPARRWSLVEDVLPPPGSIKEGVICNLPLDQQGRVSSADSPWTIREGVTCSLPLYQGGEGLISSLSLYHCGRV